MDVGVVAVVIFGRVPLAIWGGAAYLPTPLMGIVSFSIGSRHRAPATIVMSSKAFNRRAVERSHVLALRCPGGSRETVLCGGLTGRCAEALRDELSAEIAGRTSGVDRSELAGSVIASGVGPR